ncbi:MAG: MFS transporter [Pedosphaera sp.]|nr:MFS transporter [Pedosphaera sp.]
MRQPSLLIIFLTVFIDLIGFGIVMPLLPRYAERYGAHGLQIGAIIGAFSLMQLIFAPLWGQLSDRIGRRPVLLISNLGAAGAYALFAVSARYAGTAGLLILLASRVFAGICGANLSVASAYIADVTTPENRSKGMGMIGMAFGLGFILGPVVGGIAFKHFGLAGPGWVAAGLCSLNFISGLFILAESHPPGAAMPERKNRLAQIAHTIKIPQVGLLVGLYFLATFSFTCFESTIPLLLEKRFHFDEEKIGYLFAYCGLMGALIQGGLIGQLVKRFGESTLIWGSLMVVAASLAAIPYAGGLAALLVVLALFSAGSGINRAPTMGLISRFTPADEQGATLGVAQSAATLARVLGPVFATGLLKYSLAAPYLACAGIALSAGLLARKKLLPSK